LNPKQRILLLTIAPVSLVVIMFELTGALSHVLPIMVSVMTAKWVGEAFGKEGIYPQWIALRNYPWIPPHEYRDKDERLTTESVMCPASQLMTIEGARTTLGRLDQLVRSHDFNGFPLVQEEMLLGFVGREKLRLALEQLLSERSLTELARECTFSHTYAASDPGLIDLSSLMEVSVLELRTEVPLELVVNTMQKMNLRQIIFTQRGKLMGLITKSDIVDLLTVHLPHRAALADFVENRRG